MLYLRDSSVIVGDKDVADLDEVLGGHMSVALSRIPQPASSSSSGELFTEAMSVKGNV